ncbi:hypothetical protein DFH06DRAFT_1174332 [Mycena polygramma]|nr:hypothetical protein DFH06DRAFT_1174332 [Mycena polygramma]
MLAVPLRVLSRLSSISAPILEHLSVCVQGADSLCRADFGQIPMQDCPKLTVLRLRGLSVNFFRPPVTNISTLHLERVGGLFLGYERFKNLLTAAPALAHLSIHGAIIDENQESWPSDGHIALPSLVSLRISIPWTRYHISSDILISAPRLQSFVLKEVAQWHLDRFLELPTCQPSSPASVRSRFATLTTRIGGACHWCVLPCPK